MDGVFFTGLLKSPKTTSALNWPYHWPSSVTFGASADSSALLNGLVGLFIFQLASTFVFFQAGLLRWTGRQTNGLSIDGPSLVKLGLLFGQGK